MFITVVLPMHRRSGTITTSDRVFTISAILLMAVPMVFLIRFAIDEGRFYRGIAVL